MNVLSLFDGISAGQVALERAGIEVTNYYASEVDNHAIKITMANYPDTIQLGDVTRWREWDIDWASIDLLIGGSPCQGFSFAGKQLAFDDPRSKLFFVYVDILNHIRSVNPGVKFLLENVKMKKEHLAVITEQLGVEPVFVNSSLLSAQNRQRYYWANWEFGQPEDKGIVLADVLEGEGFGVIKSPMEPGRYPLQGHAYNRKDGLGKRLDKAYSLNASDWRGLNRNQTQTAVSDGISYRKLTPTECEHLQTFQAGYTAHVSNTQRYKALGNSWTVDVIAHILRGAFS